MTRLIDADALIQSLEKKHAHWHELVPEENKEIEFAHSYALNVIRNAPTISEGWIPCSKKMPDEDGEYLTIYNGMFVKNIFKVMWYNPENKCFSLYVPGTGDIDFEEVIA